MTLSDKIILLLPLLFGKKAVAFTPPTPHPPVLHRPFPLNSNIHPPPRTPHHRNTHLSAGGFGKPSPNTQKKPKATKKTSDKKKLQIHQQTLRAYGGDITLGTQTRITTAISSLPPHIRAISTAYRTVAQHTSLTPAQRSRLRPAELQKFQTARAELDGLLAEYGWTENEAHNVMQRITWDASADAKAARARTGSMPVEVGRRVERACGEIGGVVGRGGRCLDVGCGYGALVPELTRVGLRPGQIVGVDLSPEMIRNAKERFRGVTFVAGDFLGDLEIPGLDNDNDNDTTGLFDGIIFCSSLHDLPDMNASLARAAALLQTDGIVVILHAQGSDHVMGQHRANPVLVKRGLPAAEELEGMGGDVGLELVHAPADAGSEREEEEGYLAILKKVD